MRISSVSCPPCSPVVAISVKLSVIGPKVHCSMSVSARAELAPAASPSAVRVFVLVGGAEIDVQTAEVQLRALGFGEQCAVHGQVIRRRRRVGFGGARGCQRGERQQRAQGRRRQFTSSGEIRADVRRKQRLLLH